MPPWFTRGPVPGVREGGDGARGGAGALGLTELALGFEAGGAAVRHQDHEDIAVLVADVAGDALLAGQAGELVGELRELVAGTRALPRRHDHGRTPASRASLAATVASFWRWR